MCCHGGYWVSHWNNPISGHIAGSCHILWLCRVLQKFNESASTAEPSNYNHICTYQQSNQPSIVINNVHTKTIIVKSGVAHNFDPFAKKVNSQNVGFISHFTRCGFIWFSSICSTANWEFTFVPRQELTFKFKVRIEGEAAIAAGVPLGRNLI